MEIPTFDELVITAPFEIKEVLKKCEETPQSPKWHPEGNVLKHIKIVYHRARKTNDINFALAALFHDLGKASTTKLNSKGSWSSYNHERVSEKIVLKNINWIESKGGNIDIIHAIVSDHMRIKLMGEMKPSKRKMMMESPYYKELLIFTEFDNMKNLTEEELSL